MIQFFDTFSAGHHVALRPPDRPSASPLRSDGSCQFQGCFTPGISFDFPNIWQFHIWHAECVKVQTQGFIHGLQSMRVWEKETELVSSVQCSKQSCSWGTHVGYNMLVPRRETGADWKCTHTYACTHIHTRTRPPRSEPPRTNSNIIISCHRFIGEQNYCISFTQKFVSAFLPFHFTTAGSRWQKMFHKTGRKKLNIPRREQMKNPVLKLCF